jgi:Carboxypeptidase regulatory-like domain
MSKIDFNCAQQELYLVCRLGWKMCRENLTEFAKLKSRYTTALIEERLAEITAAQDIPNEKTRRDKPKMDRLAMEEATNRCLELFQTLKVYIDDAFRAHLVKSKIESAGQSYYAKAQGYNRDAVNNLMTTSIQFIQNNLDALIANDNMPNNFLTDYKTAYEKCYNCQEEYIISISSARDVTSQNTAANNDVYQKFMSMSRDAQIVFKNDEVLRRQFSFADLLVRVSGVGVAGLRGTITRFDNGMPILGALITIEARNKSAFSDELGKYDIPQLAHGTYTITIAAEGFRTVTLDSFDIKPAVYNRLDWALQTEQVAALVA